MAECGKDAHRDQRVHVCSSVAKRLQGPGKKDATAPEHDRSRQQEQDEAVTAKRDGPVGHGYHDHRDRQYCGRDKSSHELPIPAARVVQPDSVARRRGRQVRPRDPDGVTQILLGYQSGHVRNDELGILRTRPHDSGHFLHASRRSLCLRVRGKLYAQHVQVHVVARASDRFYQVVQRRSIL